MHPGDRVGGRFEILGEAARGGMGTVYRARDIKSRRDVALKLVTTVTVDDAGRFAREASILAKLRAPGIVEYISHGSIPDGPSFLVMEWVDGETLAKRLDRAGVTARDTIGIATQIARAAISLHAAGIVHRDIKPSNIMLVQDHAKLVDFGIARGRADRLTRTGHTVGTAGYMAPEQARGDAELDGRADVFALGCVVYECLAGQPAFRGGNPVALHAKVLLHDPPRLRSVVPNVSADLDAIVARMLARTLDDRPTAEQVVALLDGLDLSDERAPAHAADSATTPSDVPTCVVLIAVDDEADLARVATLAQPFEGGAIATRARAEEAATLALEVAARLPEVAIAVAAGRSLGEAIDRGARLVEQLDVVAATGAPTAGAWIDEPTASEIAGEFEVEAVGGRVRLHGARK